MRNYTQEDFEWTTDSHQFMKIYRLTITRENGLCTKCHPHKGCNAYNKFHRKRSWKEYRKYQCKDMN